MRRRLEQYFEFERLGTDWRTEILAGFTTFITMAYIIFVNPAILCETGMPFAGVLAATCISAAYRQPAHGSLRALSDRPRARHGPQRLLYLHRRQRPAAFPGTSPSAPCSSPVLHSSSSPCSASAA